MSKYQPEIAASVLGVAAFELIRTWHDVAPELSELRGSEAGDLSMKQRLLDADILVGGVALVLGTAFAVLTRDITAMIIMLIIFALMSFWYHQVNLAEKR